MIQKIILKDVTIQEFEKRLSVEASGRILSVSVKLESGVNVSIITSIGEEILNVSENGVYYPRANISARKEKDNPLTGEVQESDYYYFTDELLIEINSEGEMNGVALNELIILYDDMQ